MQIQVLQNKAALVLILTLTPSLGPCWRGAGAAGMV